MLIHTLDLYFQNLPHTIASYLLIGPEGPVLVETGPRSTLDTLVTGLAHHGFSPRDIRHVLVTHIHLDHAGAAGWLAREGAHIYVHHVGAPHIIDPSKLLASATRIYGDQMDTLWGAVLPVPADQVTPLSDGDEIAINGLVFTALDTPGHASHHHVYRVEDVAFTGDAAGIQIPGVYYVDLPAPPPEFNVELWQATIERLLGLNVNAIFPTHFGRVDNWKQHLRDLSSLLKVNSQMIRDWLAVGLGRDEILLKYLASHQEQAMAAGMTNEIYDQYEAANPHYMSVDGIMRYWRKRAPQA